MTTALARPNPTLTPNLDKAAIRRLAARLHGQVLRPGDDGYHDARRVWNASIDRHPALFVRPVGASDVQVAITFAAAHGLPVSVRGSGHNVAGNAIADGGLTIDLVWMKGISVDPERRVARAEAGLTWGEYGDATSAFGLATSNGKLTTTGLGGLTLGGGTGWLVRKHGLTIDSLLSAEVVTADGRLLTASETSHPDLFWALRGGGGNFGVVTSFQFRLHPVSTVYGGLIGYPLATGREVLRQYRDFAASAPDDLTTVAGLLTMPDGTQVVGFGACYAGPVEAGERILRPLLDFAPPVLVQFGPLPYRSVVGLFDETAPSALNRLWRSGFIRGLADDLIDTLVAGSEGTPSPFSVILIEHYGGAMARIDPTATAFFHRTSEFNLSIDAGWPDSTDTDTNTRWVEALRHAAQPHLTGGAYVNFLDDEGPERVKAAYGPNYERLVAIKRRYDPDNLFRVNQNIDPIR